MSKMRMCPESIKAFGSSATNYCHFHSFSHSFSKRIQRLQVHHAQNISCNIQMLIAPSIHISIPIRPSVHSFILHPFATHTSSIHSPIHPSINSVHPSICSLHPCIIQVFSFVQLEIPTGVAVPDRRRRSVRTEKMEASNSTSQRKSSQPYTRRRSAGTTIEMSHDVILLTYFATKCNGGFI